MTGSPGYKVLADVVESVAAAVYVDLNYDLEMLWKVRISISWFSLAWKLEDFC